MAFNQKNSCVNGIEPEKQWRKRRWIRKIAALTAFNRENSCINAA